MDTVYDLLKFVHVVAVILWIGGVAAVGSPAAGVTLIAGIAMIVVGDLGLPLWVIWGLAAILLSGALEGAVLRRPGTALSERFAVAGPGDEHAIACYGGAWPSATRSTSWCCCPRCGRWCSSRPCKRVGRYCGSSGSGLRALARRASR